MRNRTKFFIFISYIFLMLSFLFTTMFAQTLSSHPKLLTEIRDQGSSSFPSKSRLLSKSSQGTYIRYQPMPVNVKGKIVGNIINSQTAGYTISGQVKRQDNGTPIDSTMIMVISPGIWAAVKEAMTDLNGNYQIQDVPPGNYYLWASGGGTFNGRGTKWYIEKYYPDAPDPSQAQILNVTQNFSNMNFTLEEGAKIEGFVTEQTTTAPIESTWVEFMRPGFYFGGVYTDSQGYYIFGGLLAPESYHVYANGLVLVDGKQKPLYRGEFYLESPTGENATAVTVSGTDTVSNINFTLEKSPGMISGKVTRQDTGEPIDQTHVELYNANWQYLSWYLTNSDGEYFISVPEIGKYYLFATGACEFGIGPVPMYKGEYFQESANREGATLLNVTGDMADINFTLDPGFRIEGDVTEQGTGLPIAQTEIIIYNQEKSFGGGVLTDFQGHYIFGGLDTGTYYAYASSWTLVNSEWRQSYVQEYYRESPNEEGATPIPVSSNVTGIDFTLEKIEAWGSISGKVVRQDNNEPIDRTHVEVFDQNWHHINMDLTNEQGEYNIGGFAIGAYYVYCSGNCDWELPMMPIFRGEYFQESPDRAGATLIDVNGDIQDINFTLEPNIAITGKVYCQNDGQPIAEAQIMVWDQNWNWLREARSTGGGSYWISLLNSGKYYVELTGKVWWNYGTYGDWRQLYVGCYYDNATTRENATLIDVTGVTSNIDFNLILTSLSEQKLAGFPEHFSLKQNFPNPFNPTTIIEYELLIPCHVRLIIYDLVGQQIKSLVDSQQPAGHFQITWDGTDEQYLPVAAGVYFCRMEAEDFVKVIKLALVK